MAFAHGIPFPPPGNHGALRAPPRLLRKGIQGNGNGGPRAGDQAGLAVIAGGLERGGQLGLGCWRCPAISFRSSWVGLGCCCVGVGPIDPHTAARLAAQDARSAAGDRCSPSDARLWSGVRGTLKKNEEAKGPRPAETLTVLLR
jgi:hypothetical protein